MLLTHTCFLKLYCCSISIYVIFVSIVVVVAVFLSMFTRWLWSCRVKTITKKKDYKGRYRMYSRFMPFEEVSFMAVGPMPLRRLQGGVTGGRKIAFIAVGVRWKFVCRCEFRCSESLTPPHSSTDTHTKRGIRRISTCFFLSSVFPQEIVACQPRVCFSFSFTCFSPLRSSSGGRLSVLCHDWFAYVRPLLLFS